ncbi:MAG: hypothetical protein L6R38_000103 [Xanthoria sp. 2 TBL-2021]|nr:MAG: hypothetical protein L6R38_000103 [Xanthoria sp. 2 TBL-2021]
MSGQERTHDISLVGSHVKDLAEWARILTQTISAAHPRAGGSRYTDVKVLLLSWEDDDLGVATEISELDDVFRYVYGYTTDQWKIPSTQSHIALVRRILDLLADSASRDKLLIVYYGGHAYMNDQRNCVWLSQVSRIANRISKCWLTDAPSKQGSEAATAQWSSIQTTLCQADSDVLILLDCCAAASSAGSPSKGHTEIIGACGFESDSPGVGDHSFTRSLIEELRYYGERSRPISTAFLFSKILARAKDSWNPRFERNADFERRRTPIHIHLADRSKQRCIELTPMASLPPPLGHIPGLASSPSQLSSAVQSSVTSTLPSEDVDMSDPAESNPSLSSETSIESQQLRPRVLISVALEQEQILRTEDWIDWLKSFPALARWIHIESAYISDSNLLLFSLPVALWDMLPKDPAISFVSFVRSRNLLTSKGLSIENLGTGSSKPETTDTFFADIALEDDLLDPADNPSLWQKCKNNPHWSYILEPEQAKRKTSSENLATTLVGSSDSLESSSEAKPDFEHELCFRMVVHLPEDTAARRKTSLDTAAGCTTSFDTAADVNVISIKVVESLGLSKEKYEGPPLAMAMFSYKPEWQTMFDWHVARFFKTYTTTFVVLDEKHCGDFEIMIGRDTIERIGFYKRNRNLW